MRYFRKTPERLQLPGIGGFLRPLCEQASESGDAGQVLVRRVRRRADGHEERAKTEIQEECCTLGCLEDDVAWHHGVMDTPPRAWARTVSSRTKPSCAIASRGLMPPDLTHARSGTPCLNSLSTDGQPVGSTAAARGGETPSSAQSSSRARSSRNRWRKSCGADSSTFSIAGAGMAGRRFSLGSAQHASTGTGGDALSPLHLHAGFGRAPQLGREKWACGRRRNPS